MRKGAGLEGVKAAVLRELSPDAARLAPPDLAALIKALPIPVLRPRPIAEAISSAGGVTWAALDDSYMLKALPGTFIAGEMIDWEAPTGGYLLTACFGTGRAAARASIAGSANRLRVSPRLLQARRTVWQRAFLLVVQYQSLGQLQRLAFEETAVDAAVETDQRVMRTLLGDPTVIEDQQPV